MQAMWLPGCSGPEKAVSFPHDLKEGYGLGKARIARTVLSNNPPIAVRNAVLCLMTALIPTVMPSDATAAEPSKLAMTKAAFVLNFSKYTEWPASAFAAPESPITLCLWQSGSDVGTALLLLDGRNVRERRLQVRKVARKDGVAGCHILFVEQDMLAAFAARADSNKVEALLTISDAQGFAQRGGVIELVPSDARLSFEVNLDAALRAQLRLSSQLLALARIVKDS